MTKEELLIKLDEWITTQKYQEYSKNTLHQYRSNVLKFIELLKDGEEITKETTMNYKEYLYKDANAILKYPEDIIKDMTEISMSTSINKILNAFKTLSSLDNEFRYSTNPRSLFELNVLNLTMENQKDLEERVKALEEKIKVLP